MKDKIELLIDKMYEFAEMQEYEKSKKVLDDIKAELERKEAFGEGYEELSFDDMFGKERRPFTIKETYDLIRGYSIRLNPDYYPFSKFLRLTIDVHKRLKNVKYPLRRINDTRRIVAEEMARNGMSVPRIYRGIKPNRAFLDIALGVNPSLCSGELQRRAEVKLWKAIEGGDKVQIEKAKKELRNVKSVLNEI